MLHMEGLDRPAVGERRPGLSEHRDKRGEEDEKLVGGGGFHAATVRPGSNRPLTPA
jgi:hypothetical protein